MRYRTLSLLAAAALVVSASGCRTLQNLNIANPTYTMRDIRPHVSIALPLSASSIDFDMLVDVKNPNPVGLKLNGIDFNLLVNDSPMVSGYSRDTIRIPARGTGDVRLNARVGYNELRSAFQGMADMIQGNRARYELRGKAHYDTPVGRLDFPFTVYRANL